MMGANAPPCTEIMSLVTKPEVSMVTCAVQSAVAVASTVRFAHGASKTAGTPEHTALHRAFRFVQSDGMGVSVYVMPLLSGSHTKPGRGTAAAVFMTNCCMSGIDPDDAVVVVTVSSPLGSPARMPMSARMLPATFDDDFSSTVLFVSTANTATEIALYKFGSVATTCMPAPRGMTDTYATPSAARAAHRIANARAAARIIRFRVYWHIYGDHEFPKGRVSPSPRTPNGVSREGGPGEILPPDLI